jgi:toxin ParE1/3/4
MKIVWRARARSDVTSIIAYIEKESPAGAAKIRAEISHGLSFLVDWPELGRLGRAGARELIVAHGAYIVL